jgi:hypothetical protein
MHLAVKVCQRGSRLVTGPVNQGRKLLAPGSEKSCPICPLDRVR